MSHYITDGSINIPTTIQSIRIVASGEGGTGATLSGSNCTNGTTGRTTSFLGVSAGGGQSGKCGSSITPPQEYQQHTCTRTVYDSCPEYTTCYTQVQTITPDPYYVQHTCTRTVYDSCPEYTTCYTPIQTITPDPYYVEATCYGYFEVYDPNCWFYAFLCSNFGYGGACANYYKNCPSYPYLPYPCTQLYQPPSYTIGGDPYQCPTGNTYNCNPHDEQYTCYQLYQPPSYTIGGDPYQCPTGNTYNCNPHDEQYECGSYYQPPNVITGGGGGSGGTATGGNIVNSNGNSGGAGTSSPLSGGAGGTGHLGGDGTSGDESSSGSNYYFGGGGGEGAYVETIYTSAELSANNWFGTQSFSVNGGSGLNNGYLDIYFEFPQMRIKTSNGWQTVRNIYIKTGESTWSNVISAHIKQ
jgi:hypothetical protein